ncbi:uncharacterized protein LOC131224935 [Magnolia sinica]|uniref:uncharacterized protein LOC131224935 n=1 Tax=Magnolia sinica TaxID=86752 RepID=UPI00265A390E|nr:uncharacterized protein LOC131224935 [Magnolia sinica]
MLTRWLVLATFPFIALFLFLFLFFSYNISTKTTALASYGNAMVVPPAHPRPAFSLLIGILTRADYHEHRHFLRLLYGIQSSPIAEFDVKFVFCNLTKVEQRMLIALEVIRFNDIIILNCSENMNSGKTYTYFSSLPHILSRQYDYVMKADDDVYLKVDKLAASLKPLERTDLYYGFVIPCTSQNPFVDYMSGMGFVLSWDLVEWIAESDIPANDTVGPEDKLVGRWLKVVNKGKNRFSDKPAMYDYPGSNGRCSHELIPETVVVHRLKRWDRWLHVLRFFNVTKELKPSKLYHFD